MNNSYECMRTTQATIILFRDFLNCNAATIHDGIITCFMLR